MRAALDDAEERLIGPRVGVLDSAGPSGSSGRRPSAIVGLVGRQGRAMVEAHRDVGPERLLDRHGALGRQLEQAAVEVRAERHAVVGQLRPEPPG